MTITTTRIKPGGNTGIVPPWLQHPKPGPDVPTIKNAQ